MTEVIMLDDHRPHISGNARCMACTHEWVAVAPAGVVWLECPSCSTVRGLFKFPCARPGKQWACVCENVLFQVTPDGIYCPNCGKWQDGF